MRRTELRTVAARLPMRHLEKARGPLGITLLTSRMMDLRRVLRRNSRQKVTFLVLVYACEALMSFIVARGIRSSTSRPLASSQNDPLRPSILRFPNAHDNAVHGAHPPRATLHADSYHAC